MTTMTLEQIADMARRHTITPAEKRAQRISMIMGLRSKNSTLTREEVVNILGEIEGHDGIVSETQNEQSEVSK
jgi:hypothetical protein